MQPPPDSAKYREGGGGIKLSLSPFSSNVEGEREEIATRSYGREEITLGSCREGGEEEDISTETDNDGEEIKAVEDGGGEEENIAKEPLPIAGSKRKGRATIMKKAKELSTLCDIPVCVGIISPKGTTEIWPESRDYVKSIFDTNLKNIQILGDRQNFRETSIQSSQSLKIVDDHDEIMNVLNSKISYVEEMISFLQPKENFEYCSDLRDKEKLDRQKSQNLDEKSNERKRKRGDDSGSPKGYLLHYR